MGITGELCTEVSVISVWGISEAFGLISVLGGSRGRLFREPAIDSWSFKLKLSKELSWASNNQNDSIVEFEISSLDSYVYRTDLLPKT